MVTGESFSWPRLFVNGLNLAFQNVQHGESWPYPFPGQKSWLNCFENEVNWLWILTLQLPSSGKQRWRLEVGRFKLVFDGCIKIRIWDLVLRLCRNLNLANEYLLSINVIQVSKQLFHIKATQSKKYHFKCNAEIRNN